MNHIVSKPLITTIIPTYRRPKMLRRAIRSVLSQTYPHFQVCVYDNASRDETASVVAELAKMDSRVKYHCHSENIGAYKNFSYGMEHVETPFFSFLSDDDIILPEFYETSMKGFSKFPDAMFSAGSVISMTDKGKVDHVFLSSWQREGRYIPPDGLLEMFEKGHLIWTATLFRREVIEKVGVLDQDVGPPSDSDFILRIAARFPFVISKKLCGITVSHPSSWSILVDPYLIRDGWLKIISKIKEYEWIPLELRINVEQMSMENIKRLLFWNGIGYISRSDFENAYKTIEIFQDYYHLKTKAFILYTIAKLRKHFPPGYYFLVYLNKIRIFFNNIKYKQLQKHFGHYAQFPEL